MYIASILIAIIFVNLNLSAAQSDLDLPSLCCITGDRRSFRINTTFVTPDCKEQCVCTLDAFLACIPFCPQLKKDCPPHLIKQDVGQSVTKGGRTCSCPKYECVAPLGQGSMLTQCTVGNKRYKEGETFVKNCKEKCRCGMSGQVDCVPLCPKFKPCMVDHTTKKVPVPIPFTKRCRCSAQACKPFPYKDHCLVNDKKYKSGDTFFSSDCANKCSCLPGGKITCETLCKPQSHNCAMNEQAVPVPVSQTSGSTTCTCPTYKCVKNNQLIAVKGQIVNQKPPVQQRVRPSFHQCTLPAGKIYPVGSSFSNNNCAQKCDCHNGKHGGPAVLSCVPLCSSYGPSPSASCKKIVQEPTYIPDAEGKTCSCPRCV